jgi:single-strand DNA-binding protein
MSNHLSITANLTRDPELRFLPSGTATVDLGIADNRRYFNRSTNEWDEETSYFDVVAYGELAEHVAESFHRGDRAVITGRLRQERWEKDDQQHSKVRIVADEVAPGTRYATVAITKAERRQPVPTGAQGPDSGEGDFAGDEEPF